MSKENTASKNGVDEKAATTKAAKKKPTRSKRLTKQQQIEELKAENAELKDKQLRLLAEFENFRKRNAKERLDLMKTAGQDIISDLLPVIDDFDRAQTTMENATEVAAVKEGVDLISNKLRNVLEGKGLKPMETKGEEFNPDFHEAITEIPAPSDDMQGKVLDEIEKGYTLNDKIIRYAKVVVAK